MDKVEELEEKDYDDESDSCKDNSHKFETCNDADGDKLNLTTELFERIEKSTEEVPDENIAPTHLPLMASFPILSHKTQYYTTAFRNQKIKSRNGGMRAAIPRSASRGTHESETEECNYRSVIGGANFSVD